MPLRHAERTVFIGFGKPVERYPVDLGSDRRCKKYVKCKRNNVNKYTVPACGMQTEIIETPHDRLENVRRADIIIIIFFFSQDYSFVLRIYNFFRLAVERFRLATSTSRNNPTAEIKKNFRNLRPIFWLYSFFFFRKFVTSAITEIERDRCDSVIIELAVRLVLSKNCNTLIGFGYRNYILASPSPPAVIAM